MQRAICILFLLKSFLFVVAVVLSLYSVIFHLYTNLFNVKVTHVVSTTSIAMHNRLDILMHIACDNYLPLVAYKVVHSQSCDRNAIIFPDWEHFIFFIFHCR